VGPGINQNPAKERIMNLNLTREQFAVILTDLLTLIWVGWQTGEWPVAIVGLGVQAIGFVVYRLFPEKDTYGAADSSGAG